jgi:hypothetical protein
MFVMVRILLSCRRQLLILLFALTSFTFSNAQNPIVTENALTGNPASEWDVSGSGDANLQGFATDISVNKGQRVNFKISTNSAFTYTIKIYRLGYYQGNGARLQTDLGTYTGTVQPPPITNTMTGLVDCGNWSTSAFWDVPSTAVSGVYIARLTRTASSSQASHIVFIVRDDASTSDLLFQTSDATWHAYNVYGGNSLYVGATGFPSGHAAKVSYNRPFVTRAGGGGGGAGEDWLMNAEYPMIRFIERNGYNVSYFTNVDAARNGSLILNHKLFLSVGHDEYWSAEQRTNVEAARNAGVNLCFFSGNEVYWKTRWENSTDGSNTSYRTLVCYKEGTLGENVCGSKCDNTTTTWTGLWREGCSVTNGGACKPENGLTGQISWGEATGSITVPVAYKNLRFWRGTAVASASTTTTLPNGSIGYEYDFEQYTASYPPGRITLSNTTIAGNTHKLSLYRQPGGGLVFGAGTVQWSWGLDGTHDRGTSTTSVIMQQATVNLFADMGAQPGSIMAGLSAASMSTDLSAPTVTITTPAHNASITTGTSVNISGTAAEVGGGQLVGVEVSLDGGTTWLPANGTTSWTFGWTPSTAGTYSIRVRGFDDSGNMGVPGASGSSSNITVTVTGATTSATTVFQPSDGAGSTLQQEGQPLVLGMKFRSTSVGHITGVRYYKAAGTTGVHTGTLWSGTGTKLAEATFSNESASGWQQTLFTAPVAITANTTYVITYHSPSGDYVSANPYFTTAVVNGPLRGLATGEDGNNGVYAYSSTVVYPTSNYQSSNYWVDVVFSNTLSSDGTSPTVTSVWPINLSSTANISTNVTTAFSENINAATVTATTFQLKDATNTVIPGALSVSANQITLQPTLPLNFSSTYTVTITGGASGVKDPAGNALVSNYTWTFTTAANTDVAPPSVQSVTPFNATTNVAITTAVVVDFSEAMSSSSVTISTFQLKNAASSAVINATVSTSGTSITLTPLAPLSGNTAYNVVVTGGASGVKDLAGNPLPTNFTSTFTTGAAPVAPATIFAPTAGPSGSMLNEGTALTLGMKFRSSVAGFINGVRYYKATGTTGTHIGTLWSRTGTKLAEATFINESASGWQQVLFSAPVAITANTTYVVSYYTPNGHYVATNPFFNVATVNGPLTGLATGTDGTNGVYAYGGTLQFPQNNYQTNNYWVDIVFATSTGPDVTAPTVLSTIPLNFATGVSTIAPISATFSEDMSLVTLTSATFEVRNASNVLVPGTVSATATTITFTPSAALVNSNTYTAKIKGGSSGVKDAAGIPLAADYTWSFSTADVTVLPPTEGQGGPILVVSASGNAFSRYAVEILRAEGMNEFAAKDISQVTATDLNNYDVVVLGEVAVTAAQATMFSDWVNAGGTLIAFRPATTLSSLLGITKVTGTLAEGYILVNTAAGTPGAGIVGQTMQFHGVSDLYTLNGATSLGTLYTNATSATTNPAVTMRLVGSNGGRAFAFTYDLAKSIIYTRQGNPAWAAQKRDGTAGPIRSDDLYFGAGSPDWIDFNKIAIPQADEQQRLLVNMIQLGNLHRKPLPRFWFLPSGHKAAFVMTGDDHNLNGTTGQFNYMISQGPNTAQDVADWKAIRGTSYVYNGTMTNAAAVAFQNQGFEIGLHIATGCADFTPSSYASTVNSQLSLFSSTFPGLSAPATNRNHCIAWSDWATVPKVLVQNGIRLDVDYYYWPATWVLNRPGMFTGSGMPMRFADSDGSLIDCYQVPTQMTDESNLNYVTFATALLDKALGSEAYYGVFCTNMHTDSSSHSGTIAVVNAAVARGVPVVSAKQMLTWLDGRNSSYFSAITWNNGQLSFNITAAAAARNLQSMVPVNSEVGPLTSITRNGTPLTYTTQTIKGIQYAFFNVTTGTSNYVANYTLPNSAPVVTIHPGAKVACDASSVTLTSAASGNPTPTVKWQVSTNGTSWSDISGATNASYIFTPVIGDNGKQYRAVWTNSQGTVNSNAATLTVNAVPSAPTVSVVNNCGNAVLTAGSFTGSLLWSNGATTTSITVTNSATYTVAQTVNGCISAAGSGTSAPLTSSTPAPTVSVVNNCGNSVLTAGNFTGSLLWSNGATTTSITVTNAATYTVTQTVTGCTSPTGSGTSAPKAIQATPTISANGSTTLCTGGNVVLTASSATGNLWSNAATTQAITVTTTGNYSVTTTNAGGCSATSAVTAVTMNPLPAGTITAPATICQGNNATATFTATAGTGPYSVVINGTTYTNVTSGGVINTNLSSGTTSLWANTVVPAFPNGNDGQAIEVGIKFRTSVAGQIKALRFYKGNNNDANTYTLKLYLASSQALLGSVTFTNTTATGWQTVNLTTPVNVTANTTYVVSYYSPGGSYSYNENFFTTAVVNGPLTGLADGTDGVTGIYRYGTGGGYPTNSYQASNYWADVVFGFPTITMNLTSITDSKGCTVTGSLGTATVNVINCATKGTRVIEEPETTKAPAVANPSKLELGQNRPNPFEGTSLLDFSIPKKQRVRIVLYDVSGRVVRVLLDETRDPGNYVIPVRKNELKAGVYYYRLESGGEAITKKMTIL